MNFLSDKSSKELNIIKFISCIAVVCLHAIFLEIPVGDKNLIVPGYPKLHRI